jgi:hypothetical protein
MIKGGVGKRLDRECGSLSHRNIDSHDRAGADIDHSRNIVLLAVLQS